MLGLYFVSVVLDSKRLKEKRPKSESQLQDSRGLKFPTPVPPHPSPTFELVDAALKGLLSPALSSKGGEGDRAANFFDKWFYFLAAFVWIWAAPTPVPGQTSAPSAMVEVPIK